MVGAGGGAGVGVEGGGGEVCDEVVVEVPCLGSILAFGYEGRGGQVREGVVVEISASVPVCLRAGWTRYGSMYSIASNVSI